MKRPLYWLLASLLAWPLLAGAGEPDSEPVDFPLYALNGEQAWLADYRGRWVVVNYWATWCPPCLEEIPELEIFHQNHHADKAVVLGINFERISAQDLSAFVEQHFIEYPIFHQRPQRKTPFGRLPGLPTTYVLTPQGVPVAMQTGGVTADMLESFIADYEARHDTEAAGATLASDAKPASH